MRSILTRHSLSGFADTAEPLTNELCGNSYRHALGPATVHVRWKDGTLQVGVRDDSDALPRPTGSESSLYRHSGGARDWSAVSAPSQEQADTCPAPGIAETAPAPQSGEDLVLTTAARAERPDRGVGRQPDAGRDGAPGARQHGTAPRHTADAFPWVRVLPEPDLHAFAVELVDTMRAADSLGNSAAVAQLLIAWQHTAEVYSDPELLAALTRDHGEDYGPVPDPRDVA